jgi:hypothetical protein
MNPFDILKNVQIYQHRDKAGGRLHLWSHYQPRTNHVGRICYPTGAEAVSKTAALQAAPSQS